MIVTSIETIQKQNSGLTKKAVPRLSFYLAKQTVNKLGYVSKPNSINLAPILKYVPCIYYLIRFCKDLIDIKALINLGCEINAMHLAYAKKTGFFVWKIDIGSQKIDDSA